MESIDTVNGGTRKMKLAKASTEEVDALMNLMRVLNSAADGIPCKPDGTWDGEEDRIYWFDPDDVEHLRKFYDRVTACFADHPGGLMRTIGGYHLAMANDVFDPDADTYEWHPSLKEAVAKRAASPENEESKRPRRLPSMPCSRGAKRLGYMDWHEMADRLAEKGQTQTLCATCGLYQWPCEADMCPDFKSENAQGAANL